MSNSTCAISASNAQKAAIAIIPKFSSLLSIIGSSFIIYKIMGGKKLSTTFNRFLFAMSLSDMLSSIGTFVSTWAIPSDSHTQNVAAGCFYGNIGDETTCTLQGFIIHIGTLSMIIYNAMLSLYFWLRIQFNWDATRFVQAEYGIHGFTALFISGAAVVSMKFDVYNPYISTCALMPYPPNCNYHHEIECIRGKNNPLLTILFMVVPFIGSTIIIFVSMAALYKYVKEEEIRMSEFRLNGSSETVRTEQSKKVFRQAFLYASAFAVIWLPAIIAKAIISSRMYAGEGSQTSIFFIFVHSLVWPLHGFFNAVIHSPEFGSMVIGCCMWLTKPLQALFVAVKERGCAVHGRLSIPTPVTTMNVANETMATTTVVYE